MEEIAKEGMEDKIQRFLQWLQVNGALLKGCYLKYSAQDLDAGLGVYTKDHCTIDEVLMVIPLVLAITPMTVLQDPLVGPFFAKLFADGQVDDRHVMILYLMVERALGEFSFWEPYLNMLPTKFGTSVFFSEAEMVELKGTSLYNATKLQKASLGRQFTEKVKPIVESVLSSVECITREVTLEDYLLANFIFWTRALTIPCPHSLVHPKTMPIPVSLLHQKKQDMTDTRMDLDRQVLESEPSDNVDHKQLLLSSSSSRLLEINKVVEDMESDEWNQSGIKLHLSESGFNVNKMDDENHQRGRDPSTEAEYTGDCEVHPPEMVEGLVPGIDFCNHAIQGLARWAVDGSDGSITGVPNSMYLVTGSKSISPNTEITINYGNKSNEELLYLYGFVLDNNPDDYLMVHFPVQALDHGECSEAKSQLLENQELPLRWLLTSSILEGGYLSEHSTKDCKLSDRTSESQSTDTYSWSGHRKPPPGVKYQIFPEDMMGALRIIAMTEGEIMGVQNLLEEVYSSFRARNVLAGMVQDSHVCELSESSQRLPSTEDVKAAVWEVCGDVGALQLLQDLLTSRVLALEEGTGPEDIDSDLLAKHSQAQVEAEKKHQQGSLYEGDEEFIRNNLLSKNKRACVVYRRGQKHLARQSLKEAEYALERWIV